MSYPKNPTTVLFRNEFYPKGLREIQVWEHYQKYKKQIIKEAANRPIILFMYIDDEYIIKRKDSRGIIKLTESNYDELITGRTVSMSVESGNKPNYVCIDVDASKKVAERLKQTAVADIIHSEFGRSDIFKKPRVTLSANSYHVYFYMNQRMYVDDLRIFTEKKLAMEFGGTYLINKRTHGNKINFDLTPVYKRGSHTLPYALNHNGLICMDVTKDYKTFNRKKAMLR